MVDTTAVMALEAQTLDVAAARAKTLACLQDWHATQERFAREFTLKYGVTPDEVVGSVLADSPYFGNKQAWEQQQAAFTFLQAAAENFFPGILEEVRAENGPSQQINSCEAIPQGENSSENQ